MPSCCRTSSQCADEMCLVRSMNTEAINHEPAITYMQTGNQVTGKPCLGSWVSYGLGSLNQNLPTFVVLVAEPTNKEQIQAISGKLWTAGYLPGEHAASPSAARATRFSTSTIRPACPPKSRRKMLDGLNALNQMNYDAVGDPETHTRISQYEMAYRMQASVPELADLSQGSRETPSTCTARKRRSRAPLRIPRCSRGGWSSAACASCRSTTTTGTTTRTSPAACPTSAATSISPAPGSSRTSSSAACSTKR